MNGAQSYDFLEMLEFSRDKVVLDLQNAGGVDLKELANSEHGKSGNGIDFFSLNGIFALEVPVGFKRYKINSIVGNYSTAYANEHSGFTLDIATMRLMGQHAVNWYEMLPALHYEVIYDDGEPLGIITEDFSEHGRLWCSGSSYLSGYPELFNNPDIVDYDHLKTVVGIFESFRKDKVKVKKYHIMDVYPLYDSSLMYDDYCDYADCFSENLDLVNVAARIDQCRINISEIKK